MSMLQFMFILNDSDLRTFSATVQPRCIKCILNVPFINKVKSKGMKVCVAHWSYVQEPDVCVLGFGVYVFLFVCLYFGGGGLHNCLI